nr:hypothetical protein [Tanacetum cinerariifolium]
MAPLTFVDKYNMVAYLSKSNANEGFDQIMDFLNAHTIQYALVVNPTIYVSCIMQFWATAKVKKVNDVVQLCALIDGKKCLSAKRTACNEFSCSMASAVIFLATGRKFNFSKYIFDSVEKASKQEGNIEAIDADEDINLVDVEKDEETLIKLEAEKATLLNEQIAQKLHDEEVQKAAARDKQEKDDMERA